MHPNRFSAANCVSICRAISNSKALKRLYLDGHVIGQPDIKKILMGLEKQNELNILSFGENLYMLKKNAILVLKVMEKYPELRIIYGTIDIEFIAKPVDFTALLIDRCRFVCMNPTNPKNSPLDFGHFCWNVLDNAPEFCSKQECIEMLLKFNKSLDKALVDHMATDWVESTGKKNRSNGRVRLHDMANYYLQRYPTEKPPPPPPPPPPEPTPEPSKKKKKKGKKKK